MLHNKSCPTFPIAGVAPSAGKNLPMPFVVKLQ
jgi:hypothetical protein